MKPVLMPSAESRLLTVLKLNLLNCLVCASPGPACRVLVLGTTVPGRGSLGWPQTGGCSLNLAPSTDVEISHLVPFLGVRCVHRLLPDIAPFPGAVSSSKCSCDFFFFFVFSFYHRLLLMWETRAQLRSVFRDAGWVVCKPS